jgi:hypothetical protein
MRDRIFVAGGAVPGNAQGPMTKAQRNPKVQVPMGLRLKQADYGAIQVNQGWAEMIFKLSD